MFSQQHRVCIASLEHETLRSCSALLTSQATQTDKINEGVLFNKSNRV